MILNKTSYSMSIKPTTTQVSARSCLGENNFNLSALKQALSLEERVEDLFRQNKIIAHSVNDWSIDSILELDVPSVKYNWLGNLLKDLEADQLHNLSSTLLISGKTVGTYRADGILFHADYAKPVAITKGDGNTCTNKDGEVQVSESESLNNLEELREYILKDGPGRPLMNEVKGSFPRNSLQGLYFKKVSNSTEESKSHLKMLLLQHKIKQDYGREVLIYRYGEQNGTLEEMKSTESTRFALYLKIKQSTINANGKIIANVVAQTLGDKKPF
jgi:hypothetical protein